MVDESGTVPGMGFGTKRAPVPAQPPQFAAHYLTVVNKGSINMRSWAADLNQMWSRGYRLAHVFEQDGNTVQVFELATGSSAVAQ
jgi:hypothetical protein